MEQKRVYRLHQFNTSDFIPRDTRPQVRRNVLKFVRRYRPVKWVRLSKHFGWVGIKIWGRPSYVISIVEII